MDGAVLNSYAIFFSVPTGTVPHMSKIPATPGCLQRRNFANGWRRPEQLFLLFPKYLTPPDTGSRPHTDC